MSHPLTTEQLQAMRAVPLGTMPNKLRIALALADAKQTDIAESTGVAASYVSDVVNGRYASLPLETARRIATFFGCAIEDLFPAREAVA
jgi:transcriptional regulator with XRE-family HTH domain